MITIKSGVYLRPHFRIRWHLMMWHCSTTLQSFYDHYSGTLSWLAPSQLRTAGSAGAKVYSPHVLANGKCIT